MKNTIQSKRTLFEEIRAYREWLKANKISPLYVSKVHFPGVMFLQTTHWVPKEYVYFWIPTMGIFLGPLLAYFGLSIPVYQLFAVAVAPLVIGEVYLWRYSKLAFLYGLLPVFLFSAMFLLFWLHSPEFTFNVWH